MKRSLFHTTRGAVRGSRQTALPLFEHPEL